MSTQVTTSMFESIKASLNKENDNSKFKDFLQLKVDNTYIVRLLPNVKDPTKTFFHFFTFGWNSVVTGKFFQVVSPTTWEQRDPIAEARYKVLRNGSEAEKKQFENLRRGEYWLIDALVVQDPVNPENNGQVKVIRFGRQLHKIIMAAIDGEDADEFGERVFDLTAKGVNLKIKVEAQGEYPTYVSSKFTSPKALDGYSDAQLEKIYTSTHDLESYITVKSYDELKTAFDTHFYGKNDDKVEEDDVVVVKEDVKAVVDETESNLVVEPQDEVVKNLLAEL